MKLLVEDTDATDSNLESSTFGLRSEQTPVSCRVIHWKQNPASEEFNTKPGTVSWQKQASHQATPKVMPSRFPWFLKQGR